MFPWGLEDGVYFEDAALLLPWGTSIPALTKIGSPEILDRDSSVHLTWRNRRVLGGLEVHAQACQIREAPNPRAYHIYLPTFHWMSFAIVEMHEDPRIAHRQLRSLHDHFVAALGPATFSYPNYSRKLPGIFWERPPFKVSAGPQYGSTRLTISIAHTPLDYPELEAEAQRIRSVEGEGARVNHVAWNETLDT